MSVKTSVSYRINPKDFESWPLCHSTHDIPKTVDGEFVNWEIALDSILAAGELSPSHLRKGACLGCKERDHDYVFFYKAPRSRYLNGTGEFRLSQAFAGACFFLGSFMTDLGFVFSPFDTGCLKFTETVRRYPDLERGTQIDKLIAACSWILNSGCDFAAKYISENFPLGRDAYWLGDPIPDEPPRILSGIDWGPFYNPKMPGDKLLWTFEVRTPQRVAFQGQLIAILLNWTSDAKEKAIEAVAKSKSDRPVIVRRVFDSPIDAVGQPSQRIFEMEALQLYRELVDYVL